MESADNQPCYLAGAERLLCAAEFLGGALAAEGQFVKCAASPKIT